MKTLKQLVIVMLCAAFLFGAVYVIDNQRYIGYIKASKITINTSKEKYKKETKINKITNSKSVFYYDKLKEEEKKVYEKIAMAIKELDSAFVIDMKDFHGASFQDTIGIAMNSFLYDHPEVFYLDAKYKYNEYKSPFFKKYIVELTYIEKNPDSIKKQIEEVDKIASAYVEKVNAKEEGDIALALHDMLARNIKYNYKNATGIEHTVYGALVNKSAVCDGISKAYNILLNKKGIEAFLAIGTLEKEPHAWNIVKLGGEYYHTDVTANMSLYAKEQIVIHTYYNRTLQDMLVAHTVEGEKILPQATATKENYYTKYKKDVDTNNFASSLNSVIDANQDPQVIEFRKSSAEPVKGKLADVMQKRSEFRGKKSISYFEVGDTVVIKK